MIKQNLHTHTTFCDGKNTIDEMIESAIEKGYHSLGFSEHIQNTYQNCEMKDKPGYIKAVCDAKNKYADKIKIFLGGEFDYHSVIDTPKDYEYVIGSVHFDQLGDKQIRYDGTIERIMQTISDIFSGDTREWYKLYYKTLKDMPSRFDFDIVGHLDIIAKHNEKHKLYDETTKDYFNTVMDTVDSLLKSGKTLFEINCGGIMRGYKTLPYPNPIFLKEMASLGCRFLVSSDAHSVNHLITEFDRVYKYLYSLGIKEVWHFDGKEFLPEKIKI